MVRTEQRLRRSIVKLSVAAAALASFGAAVAAAPYVLSPRLELAKTEIGQLQPLAAGPAVMLAKAAPGASEDCVRVTKMVAPDGSEVPTNGVVCGH